MGMTRGPAAATAGATVERGRAAATRRQQVLLRTVTGLVGGYAFCWGFGAFTIALLFAVGLGFHDSEHLASMLTFLMYPCLFILAFLAADPKRIAIVLFGGGGLLAAAASLLQRWLV